eukprot:555861_1
MGNANHSVLSSFQRFETNEDRRSMLVNGFCRCTLRQIFDYKQFDLDVITCIVLKHYAYTINTTIRSLSKFLKKGDDYYLSIALEISKMLIQSHHSIRKQFKGATKKKGVIETKKTKGYYGSKLDDYIDKTLRDIAIQKMDFVGKSRGIHKSQPLCPAKTIDDYDFAIENDPCGMYNGTYRRCLSLSDSTINDRGEASFLAPNTNKYDKLEFDNKRLHIWVHEDDTVNDGVPNQELKFIRCLTRDLYNTEHCYWRLQCLKMNKNGDLLHLSSIGETRMDENSEECIQYLGVVHNWRQRNGGHSNHDVLPQYYEYPCGRHTVWRKVEGVSFVSAHMALCYNEFCATLPQLNNLGQSSNEIECHLLKSDSKVFWNNKFIKSIEKKIDYCDNKNEAKLIYYYTMIWLNQLIYKVALDHGFNFKKINKSYVAPHFYYKQNGNPLALHFQKHILKGRIKFYGKDVYFKKITPINCNATNDTTNVRIADESFVLETIHKLLQCVGAKLQNKTDQEWHNALNEIDLMPQYKSNGVKLIKT